MGTLDDAIREHLELKRRSGASSDEVRRLESEALDPARRDAPIPEAPPAPEESLADDAPMAEAPSREPEWLEADPFGDAPPEPDQPARPDDLAPAETGGAGGRASEYVAPDEEDEDLLEETPDFLQETPEHDRLWFEQRPPRDFDFDE